MKIAMPDGCGIHVESQGHGEPAIIFLHGIMMSGAVFKHQIGALAGDHRVITMDLRGFGQSDKPETGYSGENFVADLKHVIDHLDLKRPIIAGWSMGGAVALAFAATFPGTASRLVLIGTTPCLIQRPDWPHAVPPAAAEQLGKALATDYGAGVDGFCRMMFPEANVDDEMNFIRQIMLATPPHVTLSCMQNLGGSDLRPLLGTIREPVTVLCGAEDMVCPPRASWFLADKLGGKVTLIAGAGHCAFLTKAGEFNSALRAGL
jgi:non-heme chloroperoxidase